MFITPEIRDTVIELQVPGAGTGADLYEQDGLGQPGTLVTFGRK